ncbi:MAG TPA: hypothetical protein VIF15_10545 [Polyangiaceae bacterium]|jgi:hypothetical protein
MRGGRSLRTGVALALLAASLSTATAARTQSEDELAAARKTFAEAVADENAKRYDSALEKFRQVAAVKDTANVHYRIASCLEALGQKAQALVGYEAAVRLGQSDRTAADVVRAATARATALDKVVPRLAVLVPGDAPAGLEVRIDDAPVDVAALPSGVPLDPGHHTITATAPGDVPFRTGVTLPEGGRVSITVTLEPLAPPAPSGAQAGGATGSATAPPPPPPPPASHGVPAGAWVAIGLGGALAAGSVVSFVLRSSNLSTLDRDCTTGSDGKLSCPARLTGEVNDARNAAKVEGPLGIGLAAGAAVSLGVGIWLMASNPSDAPQQAARGVHVSPVVSQRGGMLVVSGPLER